MSSQTVSLIDPVLAELVQVRARGQLVWPRPAHIDQAPWLDFRELAEIQLWQDVADSYGRWVGASRRPVGGACALQHWSGDWLTTVLRVWLRTGHLLDLSPDRWWIQLTLDGAPAGITVFPSIGRPDASPEAVAEAVVAACTPIVDAVRSATTITARLAWGSVMTSCASVLTTVHHGLESTQRAAFAAVAARLLDAPAWPSGPLLSPVLIATADGDRLAHERHTCCLIRLGGASPCASCYDITPTERRRLMTAAVRRLQPQPPWVLAPTFGQGSPAST